MAVAAASRAPELSEVTVPMSDEFGRWLLRIQAEYREMPGLRLTKAQVRRLWGLEPAVCDALVEVLEQSRFLRRTPTDAYVMAELEY